jgi:hypothetical protein
VRGDPDVAIQDPINGRAYSFMLTPLTLTCLEWNVNSSLSVDILQTSGGDKWAEVFFFG